MCHIHIPGDGIDLMRVDLNTRELLVRLREDDCHYVIGMEWLEPVLIAGYSKAQQPAMSTDEHTFVQCHARSGRKRHEHRFEDFHRLELEPPLWWPSIEVAVTYCNCHVSFPVELVFRLIAEAATWVDWGVAEMNESDLAEWYKSAEEVWDEGWRTISMLGRQC